MCGRQFAIGKCHMQEGIVFGTGNTTPLKTVRPNKGEKKKNRISKKVPAAASSCPGKAKLEGRTYKTGIAAHADAIHPLQRYF